MMPGSEKNDSYSFFSGLHYLCNYIFNCVGALACVHGR